MSLQLKCQLKYDLFQINVLFVFNYSLLLSVSVFRLKTKLLKRLFIIEVEALFTQSCQTLCDPMDCNLPGSSVHGTLQARTLEWVAIPFSRGSSRPGDRTRVSLIAGGFFTAGATREAPLFVSYVKWCQALRFLPIWEKLRRKKTMGYFISEKWRFI